MDHMFKSIARRAAALALAAPLAFAASLSQPHFGAAPALAQDATGPQSAWIKVCEKDPENDRTMCVVTQELRDENGRFLASVGLRIDPETEKQQGLIVGLPLGMLLTPGIRVQVDEGGQTPGQFGICLPTGCFVELEVEDAFVDTLRKGNELRVLAISGRGETVPFRMSLIGFTRTYEGDPIDPEVLAASQRKLQEEIQRRAEQARQRLLEQQNSAGEGNAQQ